jgi:hypothetical protein
VICFDHGALNALFRAYCKCIPGRSANNEAHLATFSPGSTVPSKRPNVHIIFDRKSLRYWIGDRKKKRWLTDYKYQIIR